MVPIAWSLGKGLTISHHKKPLLQNVTQDLEIGRFVYENTFSKGPLFLHMLAILVSNKKPEENWNFIMQT
jgi:hypothetical protein